MNELSYVKNTRFEIKSEEIRILYWENCIQTPMKNVMIFVIVLFTNEINTIVKMFGFIIRRYLSTIVLIDINWKHRYIYMQNSNFRARNNRESERD